jgi:hypothetical protein
LSVDAVGDHIRRSSPSGRSSDIATFGGATYTAWSASIIAIPLIDRLMHACGAGGDCHDAVGGCSGVDVRAEGASTPLWAQVSCLW